MNAAPKYADGSHDDTGSLLGRTKTTTSGNKMMNAATTKRFDVMCHPCSRTSAPSGGGAGSR